MHASAAEACDFARRVQTGQRFAVRAEDAAGEVGLQAAQSLAGEDAQTHGDQRCRSRIQQPVRFRHPDHAIAQVAPRPADGDHLQVLAGGVRYLAVTGGDLSLDRRDIEQRLVGQRVHSADQVAEVVRDHEVGTVLFEGLHRRRC